MKVGIVICSRVDSRRIPEKCFYKIEGITIIEHLIYRLLKTGFDIYLAVPSEQVERYQYIQDKFLKVNLFSGNKDDPLERMFHCAEESCLDIVIRISHDKIFIDPKTIKNAVAYFNSKNLDYLYSSSIVKGAGFEIISYAALRRATRKFKNVEHVGYAIKAVTDNIEDYTPRQHINTHLRLLIDYPEDLKLMKNVIEHIGSDGELSNVLGYVRRNNLFTINKLPKVTIYTCVCNCEKYIEECVESVISQNIFNECEYIIVNDASTDGTLDKIKKLKLLYPNVTMINNWKNIGLAASSNIALENAKGEYIIRLDADDYFIIYTAVQNLLRDIESQKKDVIYSANHFQSASMHHIGGSIFNTQAINTVKFNGKLKGHEGLELFLRARDILKIGYFEKPIYHYRQHEESMSKTNLKSREEIKEGILKQHGE